MQPVYDKTILTILKEKIERLEEIFDSDVIFFSGTISSWLEKFFRNFIEDLKQERTRLTIILNTPGGTPETVEKLVTIIRYHYNEVYFVVPDYAMSAGTLFCMSGDKIFMDYSSSLGPMDPQVESSDGKFVPALGYLDKVDELIQKSKANELSPAEFSILRSLDLATLRSYEQAKDLAISLLKDWLVKYKFKDWTEHKSDPNLLGTPVTLEQKQKRAEEIATNLTDNKLWHSHNRYIGIDILTTKLRLIIDDYSSKHDLQELIRSYNDLILEYIRTKNYSVFLHSRKII